MLRLPAISIDLQRLTVAFLHVLCRCKVDLRLILSCVHLLRVHIIHLLATIEVVLGCLHSFMVDLYLLGLAEGSHVKLSLISRVRVPLLGLLYHLPLRMSGLLTAIIF